MKIKVGIDPPAKGCRYGKLHIDTIVVGDCRELGEQMEDNSVDLIWTDPPWDDASTYLYEWLAAFSARVLKDGAFVGVYTGNDWLPQIMSYFDKAGLTYYRMLSGVQLNSDDRYFRKKLFVKWRPILLYSKGEATPPGWIPDAHHTNRDKRYHKWGQGTHPTLRWITGLTNINDLVLDPFCGGGTTAAVCKMTGRHYLTFELDPHTAAIAQERLNTTQMPLIVPEPVQLNML